MSLWSGSTEESWFNFDKLLKRRVLKNPENVAKFRQDKDIFYLLSVDVGKNLPHIRVGYGILPNCWNIRKAY